MDLGHGLGHLTYSTLVHPADNWEQLWASLTTYVPKVKARVSPNAPFGVCIRLAAPTEHVLRVVAHLIQIQNRTGRLVTLAIEPEPHCFLETTDETVDYFTKHLYSGAAATRLAKLSALPISEANGALRRHLGIVFDIGH